MRLECVIKVFDDCKLVQKVFAVEDKSFKKNRVEYSLNDKKNYVEILINAADPTALRAAMTSITRTLKIIEKTGEIDGSKRKA